MRPSQPDDHNSSKNNKPHKPTNPLAATHAAAKQVEAYKAAAKAAAKQAAMQAVETQIKAAKQAIPRVTSEFSCGGLVIRDGECLAIQPQRPDKKQIWTLPKGHPEQGEDPSEAAIREIFEETAVRVKVSKRLGDVVYWYQRDGARIRKTVRFYLCEYIEGEAKADGVEVLDVQWMPLEDAIYKLAFKGDRDMASRAIYKLSQQ